MTAWSDRLVVAFVLATIALSAHAGPRFKLGPRIEADAGTYEFTARKLFIGDREVDLLDAEFGATPFSERYLAYLACSLGSGPQKDGAGCVNWRLVDTRTRKPQSLKLPRFEPLLSTPAFKWPLIAYVAVSADEDEKARAECLVYDWRRRKVLAAKLIAQDLPITDMPGFFDPPKFLTDKQVVSCEHEGQVYELVYVK